MPVFNGGLQLSRCLEALCASAYTNFEVIVVDDCSTDHTPQIIQHYGAEYLRTPHKMGPGGARNLGVEHARGSIVVFVDADVVLPPEALGLVAEDFERDPELAALFGSYDEEPAWKDFLSQYKNLMHYYVHQTSSERAITFWAGCGAVRKEVFVRTGGFNTKKYAKPSIEDIELGYRMTQAGYRILLDKRLNCKHLKRWTWRVLLRADIFYRAIPWANLILETRNLPRDLNLTFASRLSGVLVWLLVLGVLAAPCSAAGWIAWLAPRALLAVLAGLVALLLALNWDVYAFFKRKRGGWFTLRAIFAHWLYYLYGSAAFGLCVLVQAWRKFSAAVLGGMKMGPTELRQ